MIYRIGKIPTCPTDEIKHYMFKASRKGKAQQAKKMKRATTYFVGDIPVHPADELRHYGIRGMGWGKRRFQNEDGSLTAAGKNRYGVGDGQQGAGRFASGGANIARAAVARPLSTEPRQRASIGGGAPNGTGRFASGGGGGGAPATARQLGNPVVNTARNVGSVAQRAGANIARAAGGAAQNAGRAIGGAAQNAGRAIGGAIGNVTGLNARRAYEEAVADENRQREAYNDVVRATQKYADNPNPGYYEYSRKFQGVAGNMLADSMRRRQEAEAAYNNSLLGRAEGAANAVGGALQNAGNAIGGAAQNAGRAIGGAAQQLGSNIASGIGLTQRQQMQDAQAAADSSRSADGPYTLDRVYQQAGQDLNAANARNAYNQTPLGRVEGAVNAVGGAVQNAGNAIGGAAQNAGRAIGGAAQGVWNGAQQLGSNIASGAQQLGQNIGNAMGVNERNAYQRMLELEEGPRQRYNDLVADTQRRAEWASKYPGDEDAQRYVDAARTHQSVAGEHLADVHGLTQEYKDAYDQTPLGRVEGAVNAVGGAVQNAGNAIGNAAQGAWNGAQQLGSNIASGAQQLGGNIASGAQGLWGNIQQIGGNIGNAVGGAVNAVGQGAQQLGGNIASGIGLTQRQQMQDAQAAADSSRYADGPYTLDRVYQQAGQDLNAANARNAYNQTPLGRVEGAVNAVGGAVQNAGNAIGNAAQGAWNGAQQLGSNIASGAQGLWGNIQQMPGNIASGAQQLGGNIASGAQGLWGNIQQIPGNIANATGLAQRDQWQRAQRGADFTRENVTGPVMSDVTPGSDTYLNAMRTQNRADQRAYEARDQYRNTPLGQIESNVGRVAARAGTALQNAGNAIGGAAQGAWNGAQQLGGNIASGAQQLGQNIGNAAQGAWNGAQQLGGNIASGAQQLGQNIGNAAQGAWNGAQQLGGNIASGAQQLGQNIGNAAQGAWNGAQQLGGNIASGAQGVWDRITRRNRNDSPSGRSF